MRFKEFSRQGYSDHRFATLPVRNPPETSRPAYAITQRSKKTKPKLLKGLCTINVDVYRYECENILVFEALCRPYENYCTQIYGLSDVLSCEPEEESFGFGGMMYSHPVYARSQQSAVAQQMESAFRLVPSAVVAGALLSLMGGIKRLFR